MDGKKPPGFSQLSRHLREAIVRDAPPEGRVCELICGRTHCSQEQWLVCEKRIELRKRISRRENRYSGASPSPVRR
jgi:hypothetical protein